MIELVDAARCFFQMKEGDARQSISATKRTHLLLEGGLVHVAAAHRRAQGEGALRGLAAGVLRGEEVERRKWAITRGR